MSEENMSSHPGHESDANETGAADKQRITDVDTPSEGGTISFICNGCERKYTVPRKYAGRTVRCKKCDTFSVIPIPISMDELSEENLI